MRRKEKKKGVPDDCLKNYQRGDGQWRIRLTAWNGHWHSKRKEITKWKLGFEERESEMGGGEREERREGKSTLKQTTAGLGETLETGKIIETENWKRGRREKEKRGRRRG